MDFQSFALTRDYAGFIEQGKKAPSLPNVIRIANIFSVSADDLLGYQIEKTYKIKTSKLSESISGLPLNEQKKIYNVVDVMIQDYYNS